VWDILILGLARITMEDIAIIEDLKLGQLKRIADTLERLLKISEMSL